MTNTARWTEEDRQIISDMHKDAYGFRPSGRFWDRWNEATDDEKDLIADDLQQAVEVAIEDDKEMDRQMMNELKDRVQMLVNMGARNERQAMRWIIDSMSLRHRHLDSLAWELRVSPADLKASGLVDGLVR